MQNLLLWRIIMLLANEFDDYNSHLIVFSGLFSYFITEVTYLVRGKRMSRRCGIFTEKFIVENLASQNEIEIVSREE